MTKVSGLDEDGDGVEIGIEIASSRSERSTSNISWYLRPFWDQVADGGVFHVWMCLEQEDETPAKCAATDKANPGFLLIETTPCKRIHENFCPLVDACVLSC